jgi:CHAT domain-containing protein
MQIIRIDRKKAMFTEASKKILSSYSELVALADTDDYDEKAFSRELGCLAVQTGKILNSVFKDLCFNIRKESNLAFALDNETVKIPWELAYLPKNPKLGYREMLCEKMGVGRLRVVKAKYWLDPPDRRRKNKALVVGTNYEKTKRKISRLKYAEDEAEKVAQILESHGFKDTILLTGPKATKKAVLAELKKGVDLFHFTGHGDMSRNSSVICMNDYDLSARIFEKESKHCDAPRMTFFNACKSSVDTPKKERPTCVPYSWAYALAGQGGRVFVGTLWSVCEPYAEDFAQAFYKEFLGRKRKTLAEAIQQARIETFLKENSSEELKKYSLKQSDSTWSGYMLYGIPTLVKKDILR